MYVISIGSAIITKELFDCEIKISMNSGLDPDTFKITMFNVDALIQAFIFDGAIVTIKLGYMNGILNNIITGVIAKHKTDFVNGEEVSIIEGIDRTIHSLKARISLSSNIPLDVSVIVSRICAMCGVIASANSTGIKLDTYSIENEYAIDAIAKLADRVKYNCSAKSGILHFNKNLALPLVTSVISDELQFKFKKITGTDYSGESGSKGFTFHGLGLPSLIPKNIVTLSLLKDAILGNYVVETIIHEYTPEKGYECFGNIIQSSATLDEARSIQFATEKGIARHIDERIINQISTKPTIKTGEIDKAESADRVVTAKIGLDQSRSMSSVIQSIESTIEATTILARKPLMSPFAGNGFGLIVPVYQGMRSVVGFNRFDFQDADILGFLWKKGWTIPAHDVGDWMLHHKNHSKFVMKESGAQVEQVKSLRIQIGNNGLTVSSPAATDNGKLSIEFDDGSKLSYKNGEGWKLDTTGNVEIGASAASVKLAGGGKKVGRLGDNVAIDSSFLAWINAHTHATAAPGPPVPPAPPYSGANSGQIAQSTAKTEVD